MYHHVHFLGASLGSCRLQIRIHMVNLEKEFGNLG